MNFLNNFKQRCESMNKQTFIDQLFQDPDLATANALADFLQEQDDPLGFQMAEVLNGTKKVEDFIDKEYSGEIKSDIIHVVPKLTMTNDYDERINHLGIINKSGVFLYAIATIIYQHRVGDYSIYYNGRGPYPMNRMPLNASEYDIVRLHQNKQKVARDSINHKALSIIILFICQHLSNLENGRKI